MSEPLAHSGRGRIGPQTWRDHTEGVMRRASAATKRLEAIAGEDRHLAPQVSAAAFAHDLGKLGKENQDVLATSSTQPLAFDHVDAGVAYLREIGWTNAAVLAHSHHRGLSSFPEEVVRGAAAFRNPNVYERTARELRDYLVVATRLVQPPEITRAGSLAWDGPTWRLALSCLVDADHGDTAAHYVGEIDPPAAARWSERLQALDRYVRQLAKDDPRAPRTVLRTEIYEACSRASAYPSLRACDAPVGSGKTTAVMGHLLRVAAERHLRHIIVILPFTSIISQAVRVYREALVLPGEDECAVVGEHHHRVDLANPALRALASLWRTPITVTTAVQFFETLAAHHPARLRKLNELPGSAVFVDEAHAAIPAALWPATWPWLRRLVEDWGCHVVFGSGSLVRFWELPEVETAPVSVPDLLPEDLRRRAVAAETRRVRHVRHVGGLSRQQLLDFVLKQPGPRLVVVNTVQTAAVLAEELRAAGAEVVHLSTALCPDDREPIVDRVRARLAASGNPDWTLVATSCVEAGLDLSFRTGFRESASMSSLIQVGGRVGRHGEIEDATVWDFRVLADGLVTGHPRLATQREVLDELFNEGLVGSEPATLVTEAMRREIRKEPSRLPEKLLRLESTLEFPRVAAEYKVIEGDTRIVVVDRELCGRIRRGARVSQRELLRRSVQIWAAKIRRFALPSLGLPTEDEENSLYEWPYEYDPNFLGIMKGALGLIRNDSDLLIV